MEKIRCIFVDTLNGIQNRQYSEETKKPNFDKWRDYGVSMYNFVKSLQDLHFEIIFVLGYPGTGKSYALKNLSPGECAWYNADGKNPTWTGGRTIFGTKWKPTKYNILRNTYSDILSHVRGLKGKELFVDNPVAFLGAHIEDYKVGGETRQRLKVLGALATGKLDIETLSENTLYTHVEIKSGQSTYYFTTQNDGRNTCRSVEDLFEDTLIPNDFKYVLDALDEYF